MEEFELGQMQRELLEMEAQLERLELDEVERDLRKYIPLAWPIIEPNKPYIHGWHIDAIADHLMACTDGHLTKLVINIPPRHMKSLTVSVFWPSWEWIRNPQTKWLFVSYARNLVIRDAVKSRRIIQSEWYQKHWHDRFRMATDQNVKSYFENNKGGARIVGSIDAGITGEGGDRLVVDDPLKLEDAENQNAIENVNEYWDGVLASRLNDEARGVRVIIMQRLHERDLTGHVLREGGWTHLYLPTKYEPSRSCVTFYKRTLRTFETEQIDGKEEVKEVEHVVSRKFEDPRHIENELLNPKRFGPDEVLGIERRNGKWKFAGQQQQSPFPKGGGMFQRAWWRFYTVLPSRAELQMDGAVAWDCSFKDNKDSSYVVGMAASRVAPNIFLLGRFRKRMDFPATLMAIVAFKDRFPWIGPTLIEDKANGPAVISVMQSKVPGIIPRNPGHGGVEALASAVSYMVQAGNVFLPGRYDEHKNLVPAEPWVEELIAEAEAFPLGEFNDQVAALAHILFWYHERTAQVHNLGEMFRMGAEEQPRDQLGWIF